LIFDTITANQIVAIEVKVAVDQNRIDLRLLYDKRFCRAKLLTLVILFSSALIRAVDDIQKGVSTYQAGFLRLSTYQVKDIVIYRVKIS
jgi:hypothetical protein